MILGFFSGESDMSIATFVIVLVILLMGAYPFFRR